MKQENNFDINNDSGSQDQKIDDKIFLFVIPALVIGIVLVSSFIYFMLINKMPDKSTKTEQMAVQDQKERELSLIFTPMP